MIRIIRTWRSGRPLRSTSGVLVGIALAVAAPLGLAVGFYSHPVGEESHAQTTSHATALVDAKARAHASREVIAAGYWTKREGTKRWYVDVAVFRRQDVRGSGRSSRVGGEAKRRGEVWLWYGECDRRACSWHSFHGTDATIPEFRFVVDPLLETASFHGIIGGEVVDMSWRSKRNIGSWDGGSQSAGGSSRFSAQAWRYVDAWRPAVGTAKAFGVSFGRSESWGYLATSAYSQIRISAK
ncbi:MAG: hypothetical protein WDA27_04180 [Actinomycetota bacterium]